MRMKALSGLHWQGGGPAQPADPHPARVCDGPRRHGRGGGEGGAGGGGRQEGQAAQGRAQGLLGEARVRFRQLGGSGLLMRGRREEMVEREDATRFAVKTTTTFLIKTNLYKCFVSFELFMSKKATLPTNPVVINISL